MDKNLLHEHFEMQKELNVPDEHVIVDKEDVLFALSEIDRLERIRQILEGNKLIKYL